jgi:hypothetical protein
MVFRRNFCPSVLIISGKHDALVGEGPNSKEKMK